MRGSDIGFSNAFNDEFFRNEVLFLATLCIHCVSLNAVIHLLPEVSVGQMYLDSSQWSYVHSQRLNISRLMKIIILFNVIISTEINHPEASLSRDKNV